MSIYADPLSYFGELFCVINFKNLKYIYEVVYRAQVVIRDEFLYAVLSRYSIYFVMRQLEFLGQRRPCVTLYSGARFYSQLSTRQCGGNLIKSSASDLDRLSALYADLRWHLISTVFQETCLNEANVSSIGNKLVIEWFNAVQRFFASKNSIESLPLVP